ncbi:MAG: hypothetical protein U0232_31985 [Thermomicrobiales bacterium]
MFMRNGRRALTLAVVFNLLLVGLLVVPAVGAATTTVIVRPATLGNWAIQDETCDGANTGDYGLSGGPLVPPAGVGSARLSIGSNGDSYGGFRNSDFHGTLLSSINKLQYSTYVDVNIDGQAPYMTLTLDADGDGDWDPGESADTSLFFEPTYQTGTYSGDTVPSQGLGAPQPVALNQWQTWDALAGGWWDNYVSGGPPLITIASFLTAHPNAKIISPDGTLGGLTVRAGCGAGAWDNFSGAMDRVVVGVGSNETMFDFEPPLQDTATTVPDQNAVYSDPSVTVTSKTRLAPPHQSPVPQGSVDFSIRAGSTILATAMDDVDSGGNASANIGLTPLANFPAGDYTIRADYTGTIEYGPSTGTGTLHIARANTQFTVVEGDATYGDGTATVRARLRRTNGDGGWVVGATVQFKVNGTPICGTISTPACPTTDSNGWAQLSNAPLPPINAGTYATALTASFAGDANHNAANKTGPLRIARRILWVKPIDRNVVLRQPNPPTDPHLDPANCPAPSYCLELARGSTFGVGNDWSTLNTTVLRFQYARNPPSTNATEYVGKTYRITAFGISSANYDIRYDPGTMTVVAAP